MFDRILKCLMAVALIVFAVSGVMALKDYRTYRSAEIDYDHINEMVSVASTEEETSPSETKTEMESAAETEPAFPAVSIDFDGLIKVNPDFACVIYIPALDLRYPVVYSRDDVEYLTRTFDGKKNPAGCLFVDYLAAKGFTDRNTTIFGHNMKNGTMFGSLKKFGKDETLAAGNPYFYLYFQNKTYKYRIFSYYVVGNEDETIYGAIDSDEAYRTLVDAARSRSLYHPEDFDIDFASMPRLVTLSTCYGTKHVDNFVVHGVLVDAEPAEDLTCSREAK